MLKLYALNAGFSLGDISPFGFKTSYQLEMLGLNKELVLGG